MPNGAVVYDFSSYPPTLLRKDATWQASCTVRASFCGVDFYFGTDTGMGYGWRTATTPRVYASMAYWGYVSGPYGDQVTWTSAGFNFDDVIQTKGRGINGPYIEGSFAVTGVANLVLYTSGEETESTDPEELYPNYGGSRNVGEFPTLHGRLVWEWTTDELNRTGPTSATIELFGRSVTVELAKLYVTDTVGFHVEVIDDSWEDSGGAQAYISWDGVPLWGEENRYIEWSGRHDGNPAEEVQPGGKVEVGAGFVGVTNTGWIRTDNTKATKVSTSGTLYVPRLANWYGKAYAGESIHPYEETTWHLLHKWDWVDDPDNDPWTPVNTLNFDNEPNPIWEVIEGPEVEFNIEQRGAFVNFDMFNKHVVDADYSDNWQPLRVILNGNAVDYNHGEYEFGPVQVYLTPPPNEHEKDWRVGFKGKEWDALETGHKEFLDVAGGVWTKDNPNEWSATFENEVVGEGYRYILHDGNVASLQIGDKNWTRHPDHNYFDLCCPDNVTAPYDNQHTRYPLDENLLPTEEGELWGINYFSSLSLETESEVDTAPNLRFARRFHANFTGLETFQHWQEWKPPLVHENEGGGSGEWQEEYYIQRIGHGDVDGRFSVEPFDVLRVSTAPGATYPFDYYHQTIAEVGDQINQNPAYGVVQGEDIDEFHNSWAPAWFLGQGWTVKEGEFSSGFDVTKDKAIKAQSVFDSFEWSDLVGDIFDCSQGQDTGILQLYSLKTYRSKAFGSVHNGGEGLVCQPLEEGATIFADDTYAGEEDYSLNQVLDPDSGVYSIGPTLNPTNYWGQIWSELDEQISYKVGVGEFDRYCYRVAFRDFYKITKNSVSLDTTNDGKFVCAYLTNGFVTTGYTHAYLPHDWKMVVHDFEALNVCLRFNRFDNSLMIQYEAVNDDGISEIYYRISRTFGQMWSDAVFIRYGTMPHFIHLSDGTRMDYWQEGTIIKGSRYGPVGNLIPWHGSDVANMLSSVDEDSGLSVNYIVSKNGGREYMMSVRKEGTYRIYNSFDGYLWGELQTID